MSGQLSVRGTLRQAVVVLVAMAGAGVLSGVVWQWWWTPAPGVVVDHQWLQDEVGLRADFSGTGTYVAVAVIAGLVMAAGLAVIFDRTELVTLVTVLLGSVLAAWVMYRVGLALAPADPDVLATTAADGTRLPGPLIVSGQSPFLAFPTGAVIGLMVVFFSLSRRHRPVSGTGPHE